MIRTGNLPCVRYLWEEVSDVKWNLQDSRGWNVMHYAAFSKDPVMIKWCNKKFDKNFHKERVKKGTMRGLTPVELSESIIKSGSGPGSGSGSDSEIETETSYLESPELRNFMNICTNIDLVHEFIETHSETISKTYPKCPSFCKYARDSIVVGGAEAFRALFRRKIYPEFIS